LEHVAFGHGEWSAMIFTDGEEIYHTYGFAGLFPAKSPIASASWLLLAGSALWSL
jgi:hypothetical protein